MSGVLKEVPSEATDEEAAKLYEKIMGMIKQMNPEKEEEFSKHCQLFGTCPPEQGECHTPMIIRVIRSYFSGRIRHGFLGIS